MSEADRAPSGLSSVLVADLHESGFEQAHEVGRGGFGVVFRAKQRKLDRAVAVKVLTAGLDQNRSRFIREQHAMGRLTGHPNVVAVLEVGESVNGYPYLVMPLYGRGSLHERISRRGALAVDEALAVAVKISSALESAHRIGILHRDVKPGNILLSDNGEPALTDFGIAHIPEGFTTASGVFIGSPAFTAPEVIIGEKPSESSDIYSLGATLFAMLTAHAPVERRSGEKLLAQFLRMTSGSLPDFRGIPSDIADITASAMAREPQARPTARELGRRLQEAMSYRHPVVDSSGARGANPRNDGTEASFLPRSTAMAAGTAPAPVASFVGRRGELAEVGRLLASSRLVTIMGVGGVGKTTLATRAATKYRRDFTDGVWLIELADLRQSSLLVEFVAGALGLRDKSEEQLADGLVEHLQDSEVLLVLDNCEHVVDVVAELVDTILRCCPRVTILATSRERINIEGETALMLSPMPYPTDLGDDATPSALSRFDAIELFVQRAGAADANFVLTEDNAIAVAKICGRLEGLPLAIELAAARLRILSVDQILDALADRFALLTRGRRGAPTRQQTLESCIDWGYQFCTPNEQRLFDRLSVFAGTFDMRAAHHVCGNDFSPVKQFDLLAGLVDKSMLVRAEHGGHVRFRLLETLRDYGDSHMSGTDDHLDLRRRHADWYRRLVADANAEWFSGRQVEWIDRVIDEMPNIRQALEFTVMDSPTCALEMTTHLRRLWSFHGMITEGRRWAERALQSKQAAADPSLLTRTLFTDAALATLQGDIAAAGHRIMEVKNLLARHDDALTRGLTNFLEGYGCMVLGTVDHGIPILQRALDASNDVEVQGQSKIIMGWLYATAGDYREAAGWFTDALAVSEVCDDSVLHAQALSSMAVGHWLLGDTEPGKPLIRESLRRSRTINDLFTGAQSLEMLSWIVASEGDGWRSAVLRAAGAAVSRECGSSSVLHAAVGPFHSNCDKLLTQLLSPADLEAAHTIGDAMTLSDAAEFVLSGDD
ncbi:protein kinase [Mycolicibacterium boenickei]